MVPGQLFLTDVLVDELFTDVVAVLLDLPQIFEVPVVVLIDDALQDERYPVRRRRRLKLFNKRL